MAPRLAISWAPFGNNNTVVRTGLGWFYDRVPLVAGAFSAYPTRIVDGAVFENREGSRDSAGPLVFVGGMTSVNADGVVLGTNPYEQTIEILRKIEHELSRVGASLSDVVQTRMYVTDISRSEEVGRAHGEVFGEIRPLMTMVGIEGLVDPRMLVEVEMVALAPSTSS